MIKIQRQNKILKYLSINGTISISSLSKEFNCSEETIRNDLKQLELISKLKRTHGGAYIEDTHDRGIPNDIKENLMLDEKRYIAELAIKYIKNNNTIMLDSSTTCIELVKKILETDLYITIITNSLQISNLCINSQNIKIILVAGKLNKKTKSLTGHLTTQVLELFKPDISFISFPTIDKKQGFGDNTIEELTIRNAMLSNSRKNIILLDNTKFRDNSSVIFTPVKNIDIVITDKKISTEWKSFFENLKIEVIF
ncbi:DeoR/GlpR family DNA-binding transcription regulator [Caviibacter abscessus]|uniref:DeoR/GlpR family DNA-binding transcription regulator n=1 Tax=Caviibacter abscessus TaxID=1766719 RepID=UPI000831555C|nr:DeoR/GlpR family DNA-binding transcription regulator [Caviibacter abscessus]